MAAMGLCVCEESNQLSSVLPDFVDEISLKIKNLKLLLDKINFFLHVKVLNIHH